MNKKLLFLASCLVFLPLFAWLSIILSVPQPSLELNRIKASTPKDPKPLKLSGQVKANRQITLRFPSAGLLNWVGVKEGDQVEKGQVLKTLDKRELEKTLKKEMNDYLNERWDFEQTHDDYEEEKNQHLITDEIKRILEKAKFDLNNAVLDYEIKNLALEYATLISPIDGIVTHIDQPIAGVYITPATAEITIVDPSSVYFELKANEQEITKLKENMVGKIVLNAYPNKEFDTLISKISFAPKSTKGSPVYTAHCSLPTNKDFHFRLGMTGEIEIDN